MDSIRNKLIVGSSLGAGIGVALYVYLGVNFWAALVFCVALAIVIVVPRETVELLDMFSRRCGILLHRIACGLWVLIKLFGLFLMWFIQFVCGFFVQLIIKLKEQKLDSKKMHFKPIARFKERYAGKPSKALTIFALNVVFVYMALVFGALYTSIALYFTPMIGTDTLKLFILMIFLPLVFIDISFRYINFLNDMIKDKGVVNPHLLLICLSCRFLYPYFSMFSDNSTEKCKEFMYYIDKDGRIFSFSRFVKTGIGEIIIGFGLFAPLTSLSMVMGVIDIMLDAVLYICNRLFTSAGFGAGVGMIVGSIVSWQTGNQSFLPLIVGIIVGPTIGMGLYAFGRWRDNLSFTILPARLYSK